MLISSRSAGDTLRIPDVIEVTVLEVKGNQVRIGITAPNEVPVYREEIYRLIMDKQKTKQQRTRSLSRVFHTRNKPST